MIKMKCSVCDDSATKFINCRYCSKCSSEVYSFKEDYTAVQKAKIDAVIEKITNTYLHDHHRTEILKMLKDLKK